jgi:uncharacterized membrane protein
VTAQDGEHLCGRERAQLSARLQTSAHRFLEIARRAARERMLAGEQLTKHEAGAVHVTERFFEVRGAELVTRTPIIPIMITTNAAVAAIDCLFYVVPCAR